MIGIYKITSPTGKIYIGQSRYVSNRKNNYKNLRCKNQPKLYSSLVKHGWNNHSFEIVYELPKDTTQEVLNRYEILYWQQYLDCGFEMMNLKEPGSFGKHKEESIRKREISRQLNGTAKRSEETRLKIGTANKGKRKPARSLEHRENLSKSNKGRVLGKQKEETKQRRQETRKNRNAGMKKILHVESNVVYNSRKEAAEVFNWTAENINYHIKKGSFKYI